MRRFALFAVPVLLLFCAASPAQAQILIGFTCDDGRFVTGAETCPEDLTPEQRREEEARQARDRERRRVQEAERERERARVQAELRAQAQGVMARHNMARHREQEAIRLFQMQQAAAAARNPIRRNLNPLSCGYNGPPLPPRPPRPPGSGQRTCQQ